MSTKNGQFAEHPLGVELNPSLINERSTECVNLLITGGPCELSDPEDGD